MVIDRTNKIFGDQWFEKQTSTQCEPYMKCMSKLMTIIEVFIGVDV